VKRLLLLFMLCVSGALAWAISGTAPTTVQNGALTVPGLRGLFWYRNVGTGGPGERWYGSSHVGGVTMTLFGTVFVDTLVATPFWATRAGTIDKLAFRVATGNTGNCTAAIYDTATHTTSGQGGADGTATTVATAAQVVTAGPDRMLVVGLTWQDETRTTTLADTAGNVFTQRVSRCVTANCTSTTGVRVEIWSAPLTTGNASDVVTATFSATTAFRRIMAVQYTGLEPSSTTDSTGTGTATSTSQVTTSAAVRGDTETIVAYYVDEQAGGTFTAGTNFNLVLTGTAGDTAMEERIVTGGAGTFGSAMTYSNGGSLPYVAVHASFMGAHSASTLYPGNRVAWCPVSANTNSFPTGQPNQVKVCGAATAGDCTTCTTAACTICRYTNLTTAAGASQTYTVTANRLYWLALSCDNTTVSGTMISGFDQTEAPSLFLDTGMVNGSDAVNVSSTYTAPLPALFPSGAATTFLGGPAVLVHYAS
jgi:hypothetical protein